MNQMTIVVVRYREGLNTVKSCLNSLANQEEIKADILFLDQNKDNKIITYLNKLNEKGDNVTFLYENIPDVSLSYARNYGVKRSKTSFIAFTDPDCIVTRNWAYKLYQELKKNNVAIVGGKVIPLWTEGKKWYCKSIIIQELLALINLSDRVIGTKKIVGANFAINKKILGNEAYFKESLGRIRGIPLGGEETDLCERAHRKGFKVVYTPFAVVYHKIPKERLRKGWFVKRIFYGGVSRALRGGKPEQFHNKRNFYDFIILPPLLLIYSLGFIYGKLFG